jgi:glucan phosphoethanolaminetransferase (alkaline phosphatase superfamily)
MDIYRPLGAGLFLYECLRLLLLVFFMLFASLESAVSGSYTVYMSSNALFAIMAMFIWLRPDEYRNYIALYMAGKLVFLASFYSWEIFTLRDFIRDENFVKNIVLMGGGAIISLADMLSVWGAWAINKKYRRAPVPESGGV